MPRSHRWIIEDNDNGTFDVVYNGRRLRSNVTMPNAVRYIREHKRPSDNAYREEPDGYLVKIA
jgi:hypothetical protein